MHDADLEFRWRTATSFADLTNLAAEYFEGSAAEYPHTFTGDPAGLGENRHVLADLNRAGFLTLDCTPGRITPWGFGRPRIDQRAAVQGFCDALTMEWLTTSLFRNRHQAIAVTTAYDVMSVDQLNPGVAVQLTSGRVSARFGQQFTHNQIQRYAFGGLLGADAVRAVAGAWNVTIFDTTWGANDLWRLLAHHVDPELIDARRDVRRRDYLPIS